MKKFVDDISVLAVESCLIRKLTSLFCPEMVYDQTEDDITCLAAKSEETATERTCYADKLAVLEAGLRDFKRLDKHHSVTQGKSLSSSVAGVTITWQVMMLNLLATINILTSLLTDIQLSDDENLESDEDKHEVSLPSPPTFVANGNDTEGLEVFD